MKPVIVLSMQAKSSGGVLDCSSFISRQRRTLRSSLSRYAAVLRIVWTTWPGFRQYLYIVVTGSAYPNLGILESNSL